MLEAVKKRVEKIRNSDEASKKRWVVFSSAVAMLIVVGLWMIYLNLTNNKTSLVGKSENASISFWQIFKTGLSVTAQSVKDGVINLLTSERIVNIEK